MLFIYSTLALGGIETFFVRMAKERHRKGLVTKILLLSVPEQSNMSLLREMKKYARVYFISEIYTTLTFLFKKFPLLAPINKNKFTEMLDGVTQLHAFGGMHLLLANRFNELLKQKLPITFGFYHYITYAWGKWDIAYYERIHRKFLFEYLPRKSIMFCTEGVKDFYIKQMGIDLSDANNFRLGVVDKNNKILDGSINKTLKIVAVGRLVEFKTYNFFMLNVLKNLLDKGVEIIFDVYGDGSDKVKLETRIKELGIEKNVFLKGSLEYDLFDSVIQNYDIFIGSGTAVIQAAGLGVPSIIGIENMLEPKTYGYFSDVYMHEYNIKGLDLPLLDISQMIMDYIALEKADRKKLKQKHIDSIEIFTNEFCSDRMEEMKNIQMPKEKFKYNSLMYEVSRVIDIFNIKLNKKHPRIRQFDELKYS